MTLRLIPQAIACFSGPIVGPHENHLPYQQNGEQGNDHPHGDLHASEYTE